MPIIRFGNTINNVNIESVQNLLRVSAGKVLIDLSGTDLKGIFQKSKYAKMLEYTDANDLTEDENDYFFDLHSQKLDHILSFLLS